jgi:nucleotide-binding universal stress UspA family protein
MKVLAAVDMTPGSDKVLGFAAGLAKETGGEVHVVHIISDEEEEDRRHPPGSSSTATFPLGNPVIESQRAAAENDVEQRHYVDVMLKETKSDLMRGLMELGVAQSSSTVIVRFGNPVHEIQRAAIEGNVDALVIGMRRRSRVGKFLLGSDLQELLLASDRPVIAVPI